MGSGRRSDRWGLAWWCGAVAFSALGLLTGVWGPLADRPLGGAALFFWVIVVGAAACWVGGLMVLVIGRRDAMAEVSLLGAVLMVELTLASCTDSRHRDT